MLSRMFHVLTLKLHFCDHQKKTYVLFPRNDWEPPDKKVDTRKYRAEPKSIYEYQPGKSSVLNNEKLVMLILSYLVLSFPPPADLL